VLDCGGPAQIDDVARALVPALARQFTLAPVEAESPGLPSVAAPAA
jgi:hypothetical protein